MANTTGLSKDDRDAEVEGGKYKRTKGLGNGPVIDAKCTLYI